MTQTNIISPETKKYQQMLADEFNNYLTHGGNGSDILLDHVKRCSFVKEFITKHDIGRDLFGDMYQLTGEIAFHHNS